MPNPRSRRTYSIVSLSIMLTLLFGAPEALCADETPKIPSAIDGRAIAEKFCKSCHLIGPGEDGATQVGPPSFPSIANKKGQSAKHIEGVLIQPHTPMPDMHLTNEEILDIIAYLDTLRSGKSTPPLLQPGLQNKPKFPSPS